MTSLTEFFNKHEDDALKGMREALDEYLKKQSY